MGSIWHRQGFSCFFLFAVVIFSVVLAFLSLLGKKRGKGREREKVHIEKSWSSIAAIMIIFTFPYIYHPTVSPSCPPSEEVEGDVKWEGSSRILL
jgi:4-amino-4-deoxy-L-arabinose transferase-like glycosyltransferase